MRLPNVLEQTTDTSFDTMSFSRSARLLPVRTCGDPPGPLQLKTSVGQEIRSLAMTVFEKTDKLYENSLASDEDLAGFRTEGTAAISFSGGRMRMKNAQ